MNGGLLMLLARPRIVASATSTPSGYYEFLRPTNRDGTPTVLPRASDYGPGMLFNSDTGELDGTAVDTTWPVPALTWAMDDSGVAATNTANVNAKIVEYAASATGNVRITIPAGADYTDAIELVPITTGFTIELCTAAFASLPHLSPGTAPGTYANRVDDSHIALMPRLFLRETDARVIQCADGAKGYYLRGLSIKNPDNIANGGALIWIAAPTDNEADSSKLPENICLAQFHVDGGTPGANTPKRFAFLQGRGVAITDSYITNIGAPGSDPQGINIRWGEGPFKVHNNTIESIGAGENMMVGGGDLPGTEDSLLPSDIEYSGNYLTLILPGGDINPGKNLGEIKMGRYIAFVGNRTDCPADVNTVHGCQFGFKVTTNKNLDHPENHDNVFVDTHDIVFMHNWTPRGAAMFSLSGAEYTELGNDQPKQPRNFAAINNLGVATISERAVSVAANDIHHVSMRWNTFVARQDAVEYKGCIGLINSKEFESQTKSYEFDVQHNVLVGIPATPDWTVICFGGPQNGESGQTAFDDVLDDSTFAGNVCTATGTKYNRQIGVDNLAAVKFVNPVTDGDWSLRSDSPGHAAGPNGQDKGYQKTVFDRVQARVAP